MPPEIIKAYNILDVGENDAEINMYGEVVDTRPIDFWTGEPVGGNFIMLDEFLRDLDGLKSKANRCYHRREDEQPGAGRQDCVRDAGDAWRAR